MGNVVSFSKEIDKLSPRNIIRLDNPVDEGARAFTQPCSLRWGDGSISQAYIKIFPAGLKTCIINELTGFAIGRGCQLPLPDKIGMLKLPDEVVSENKCCEWAIVVSEVPGVTLKSIYKRIGPYEFSPVFARLFEWSRIEDVLAFDDWIANSDRNIGNVVIASESNYYLIDHSDALVKPNWTIPDLDPEHQAESVLASGFKYNENVGDDKKTKLILAAQAHSRVYEDVSASIESMWDECSSLVFTSEAEEVVAALKNFIQKRADEAVARIQENTTLLKAS